MSYLSHEVLDIKIVASISKIDTFANPLNCTINFANNVLLYYHMECKILFSFKNSKLSKQSVGSLSITTQPAFTCSKLTIEILEQGVKYVQS